MDFFRLFLDIFLPSYQVTKITTGHQKLNKIGQNSILSSFFAGRAKKVLAEGWSPPQELEVGPRSGS